MNFLKNLFGGGGGNAGQDSGLYFYVQPRGCEEVVQVRINPANDLSPNDDYSGYFVRKTVRGTHRCFNPMEMTLTFNKDRRLIDQEITGGTLVDADTYHAWEAALAAKKAANRAHNEQVEQENEAE